MSAPEPVPFRPRMIAIGGLSGSGKTTLAHALGQRLKDYAVLDSDVLRKRMHGVDPLTPLPANLYTPENTAAFIKYARAEAAKYLAAGQSVIVTGTFLDNTTRREQRELAEHHGADFIGLYLDMPVSKLFARVSRRRDNPSDACVAILRRQLRAQPSNPSHQAGWHVMRGDQRLGKAVAKALSIIHTGHHRQSRNRPPRPPRP